MTSPQYRGESLIHSVFRKMAFPYCKKQLWEVGKRVNGLPLCVSAGCGSVQVRCGLDC